MPRHARLQVAGGIYHVIQRGIERKEIFCDDADRKEFVRRLSEGLSQTGHKCYGWVLMPNHFHLLIRTGAKPLTDLMRKLLTGYALYFNKKYKRNGYLYQGRYKSILCHEESYLLELIRYIHLNPWRAKQLKDIKELNTYPWSGHAVLLGNIKNEWQSTGEILERFGDTARKAKEKYWEFVLTAKDVGQRDDLTGGGLRRSAGGWSGVFALRANNERWQGDERVLGDGEFVNQVLKASDERILGHEKLKRDGWDFQKLVNYVCRIMSVNKEGIYHRSRKNQISQARELIMYWGKSELNLSGRMLAGLFKISSMAVSKSIQRGELLSMKKGLKFNS
jgi:putative transposase